MSNPPLPSSPSVEQLQSAKFLRELFTHRWGRQIEIGGNYISVRKEDAEVILRFLAALSASPSRATEQEQDVTRVDGQPVSDGRPTAASNEADR